MPSSITASFSLSMAQWGTFLGFGLGVLLKITKGKAKGKMVMMILHKKFKDFLPGWS